MPAECFHSVSKNRCCAESRLELKLQNAFSYAHVSCLQYFFLLTSLWVSNNFFRCIFVLLLYITLYGFFFLEI